MTSAGGSPTGTTGAQIAQSDWLRRHENPSDSTTQRDNRVRARAVASRIIAKVDVGDRLPDVIEQEEAADRAELAQLCGRLAVMDVPIETNGGDPWLQSHQHAHDAIASLPNDANVEALMVNGTRIPIDPIDAAARYGESLRPGRVIDDDDEDEEPANLEENV